MASLNLSKMLSWTKQREPVVQTCPFLNNKACWGFYTAASKSASSGVTLGLLTSDYSTSEGDLVNVHMGTNDMVTVGP